MYQEKYSIAVEIFQDVLELMHSAEGDIFTDNIIIEEENCEILYNIALCNTLNRTEVTHIQVNYDHALLILKELAEVVNTEHRGQLYLISAIIELGNQNKEKAEMMLKESAKSSPEVCKSFLNGEEVAILPLHTGNEFSSMFKLITFPGFSKVKVRPAVTLPKFLPPLDMKNTCEILRTFFNVYTINPRPEAPWLNRTKGSIQFTDSILEVDVDDSKKVSKKVLIVPKVSKSQQIRKKQSSFVKDSKIKERVDDNGLFKKIKEICS